MNLCRVCWINGRSLWQGSCLCTGDVLSSSAFYEWMGENLEPLPERVREAPKPVFASTKPRLVFGEEQEKKGKKRDRKIATIQTASATPSKPE